MSICEKREFELLKKIGFVRQGGTSEELKAANILMDELNSIGVEGKLEAFAVQKYNVKKVKLEILEPYFKEYTVTAMGRSGSTPEDGITAEFEYVEQCEPSNLINAKGKIVLINGGLTIERYKNLVEAQVAGFITFCGSVIDDEDKTDIETRTLRQLHLDHGQVPGVTLRVKDAMEIVNMEATKVRMVVEQDETSCDSHNLIAEIKGTEYPEEVIVFMAHYDSVPFSPGVYDNGSGTVIIMELLRYYLENLPKRTLRFIWFGSEEMGLLGSKAYVKDHEDELEKIIFGINVDVAGAILGEDKAMVIAKESLCHMIDYTAKEMGFHLTVQQSIYSSDCIPFADKGIPVVNFARFGAPGAALIHNRYDVIEHLSPKSMGRTTNIIKEICHRIINANIFPVPREIPDNMVEEVNKYLRKDKKNK